MTIKQTINSVLTAAVQEKFGYVPSEATGTVEVATDRLATFIEEAVGKVLDRAEEIGYREQAQDILRSAGLVDPEPEPEPVEDAFEGEDFSVPEDGEYATKAGLDALRQSVSALAETVQRLVSLAESRLGTSV